ncbi:IS21 family transposase, partial [Cutibacterium acnes]
APADKLFVDYAGATIDVVDGNTGEVRRAQVFVAVLGASNYTFAEATWTQGIADWVGSHVRALNFFGGSPRCVVPDNLKSGVTRAVFFEPTINETYADWARHYGIAILPTRVGKPKDKAKVEGAVLIAERWIIAALRNEKFFSLTALNRTISELLASLNTRPFKKMPGSRQSAFESLDKPELLPLPSQPYEFAD